jgi:GTP cyclohydrolase IA
VIQRKYNGGSCPNIACLPSKNIIQSAKNASHLGPSEEFGLNRDGFTVDMSAMRDRKRRRESGLIDMPTKPVSLLAQDTKSAFREEVRNSFALLLDAFAWHTSVNPLDSHFRDTPARVGRAYAEMFDGLFDNGAGVKQLLCRTFPAKSEEMITMGPIKVFSICPHHFLPVEMKVWLAYIPHRKVLGLSKLARLAELLAKKPALQEDTTVEIAQKLQEGLKPKGVACLIKGRHFCMVMRGARQDVWTTTTSLQGAFLKDLETRAEFLDSVRSHRGFHDG